MEWTRKWIYLVFFAILSLQWFFMARPSPYLPDLIQRHQRDPSAKTAYWIPLHNSSANDPLYNDFCGPFRWLEEYARFHKQMKGTPDAKYIVITCNAEWGIHYTVCGGVSDRLRTMSLWLELAFRYKRVLLIMWEDGPEARLENFMTPNHLDWRVTPELAQLVLKGTRFNKMGEQVAWTSLLDGEQQATVWILTSNMGRIGPLHHMACVSHFLFLPSELVRAEVVKQQQMLFGESRGYVAIHARFGDEFFDETKLSVADRNHLHSAVDNVVLCALQVRKRHFPSFNTSILLLTNAAAARSYITKGPHHSKVLLSPNKPVHVERSKATLAGFATVFVDLYLIAGASCLVVNQGGFGKFAASLGPFGCVYEAAECVEMNRYYPHD